MHYVCLRNILLCKDEFNNDMIANSISFSTSNNLFSFFWMSHFLFSRSLSLA